MSRRARKQQSDRAPASGARSSNERGRQRKQQRVSRREQERPKSKAALVVVPHPVSDKAQLEAAREPTSLQGAAANRAAEWPLSDGALPDVELAFFEGWSLSAPDSSGAMDTEPSELIADDVASPLLTPEEQQRRQWFRRQVTALMAGMGAFGAAAVVMRVASLL
jgi:hypothetical protein